MDTESLRRFLLEHSELEARFPNWSSTVNLTDVVQVLLREIREEQAEEAELARLDEVSQQFKRYYLYAILVLGLPGNLASLLTFLRMRNLGSCVVYVAVLAVVDSLALVEKLVLSLLQQHRRPFTEESCKALLFVANALVIYANWIVVALAAERLFAVCRPLAVNVYCTRPRVAAGLAVLMLLSLLVCVPVLVISVPRNDTLSCVPAVQHREMAHTWHWANVTLYGFLPCLSLLAINIAIISLLRRARRKQLQLCQVGSRGSINFKQRLTADSQRQASVILLVASFMLIVLTTPRCALLLMQYMWEPRDVLLVAKVRVLKQVTHALADLNHAINFYLYFVSARLFRRRFLDLFRSTRKRLRRLSTRETQHHRVSDYDRDSVRLSLAANRPDSLRKQQPRMRTDTF